MTRRVLRIALLAVASGGPLVRAQAPAAPPLLDCLARWTSTTSSQATRTS
jgi:hypothetical protein